MFFLLRIMPELAESSLGMELNSFQTGNYKYMSLLGSLSGGWQKTLQGFYFPNIFHQRRARWMINSPLNRKLSSVDPDTPSGIKRLPDERQAATHCYKILGRH